MYKALCIQAVTVIKDSVCQTYPILQHLWLQLLLIPGGVSIEAYFEVTQKSCIKNKYNFLLSYMVGLFSPYLHD